MKINHTYPKPQRETQLRSEIIKLFKYPMLFAGYICIILNLVTGEKAWSIIVVWSLWIAWTTLISPSLIEYNRISQSIKAVVGISILLILIDLFLAPGWAVEVVSIVCFSGLVVSGLLFFTDIEKQKQNMLPMLLLIVVSIVSTVIGLIVWKNAIRWIIAVTGAVAFALLFGLIILLGSDFIREINKRFHTK